MTSTAHVGTVEFRVDGAERAVLQRSRTDGHARGLRGDEKPHVRLGFNHDMRPTFASSMGHVSGIRRTLTIQSP